MMAYNLCYSTLLPLGTGDGGSRGGEVTGGSALPDHLVAPQGSASGTGDLLIGEKVSRFVTAKVRRGLLPMILEDLIAARKVAKKEMAACAAAGDETRRAILNARQLALKLS